MNQTSLIFDRKRRHFLKSRAASREGIENPYFLHDEIESILSGRLSCVRAKFAKVLLTAPASRGFIDALLSQGHGTDYIVELHPCASLPVFQRDTARYKVVGDEEALPFLRKSFELIISCLNIHSINNVLETLRRSQELLTHEGLYLAAFFGGETLCELRESLLHAEIEITGGAAPRVHPMITPEDATMLFSQAGFKLPVIDREKFRVIYPSLLSLLKEIKSMAEGNSLIERSIKPLSRTLLKQAEVIYQRVFGTPEKMLPATVDVVFLTGWK